MDLKSSPLHVTLSFKAGVPPSEDDQNQGLLFWRSPTTIEWFRNRGYTLYDHLEEQVNVPARPSTSSEEGQYPWPYYNAVSETKPLWVFNRPGKVVYAQDASNRHVVIKVVRDGTDEYRVLRFLSEQHMDVLQENGVIPVLDLIPTEGYWFVVMPRWGTYICFPTLERLYEVVDIIHCMLKGLAFLHKNNIVHGDINLNNVAINQFSDQGDFSKNLVRKQLRLDRRLSYALFDFDFSVVLPSNTDRSKFRLPYERSFGNFNNSGDTAAGEYDYDPFAFDVGGMGMTLYCQYDSLIPLFPGLAPLFDMMTTWDVSRRFTATQALEFYEARLSELSEAQLQINISRQQFASVGRDPWETLPLDAKERWKMYKTLPQPWSRRLLCWISGRWPMWHIVPWTRWFFFQVFSALPRRVYGWFFGL